MSRESNKTLSPEARSELANEAIQTGIELGRRCCFEEALAQFDQALKLCKGGTHARLKEVAASAHANKGAALGDMEQFPEAIACYDKAIAAYTALADQDDRRSDLRRDSAISLMNKGWALLNLGKEAAGLACHEQSLAIQRALLDDGAEFVAPDVARALYNVGEGYIRTAQLSRALPQYQQAIEIWQSLIDQGQTNYEEDVVFAISSLADAYHQLGNLPQALKLADQSIKGFMRLIGDTENPRLVGALDTTVALRERVLRELESQPPRKT